MFVLLGAFLFFLGGIIGSFLNVLIERIPRGETVMTGRSHCDSCGHVLEWYDLIPFFSFIFLRGHCRYCHKSIELQTLGMELFTGSMFAVITLFIILHRFPCSSFQPPCYSNGITGLSLAMTLIAVLYSLFMVSCFLVIAFIDAKHGIIPNAVLYPAAIITILYHMIFYQTALPSFIAAGSAGLFFLLLFILTQGRGMGFGDVKLSFVLGLFLGFPGTIIALYLAFLTGAVSAFILVIRKKKKFSGGTIAFGPFLILGTIIAFFFGDFLWNHLILRGL